MVYHQPWLQMVRAAAVVAVLVVRRVAREAGDVRVANELLRRWAYENGLLERRAVDGIDHMLGQELVCREQDGPAVVAPSAGGGIDAPCDRRHDSAAIGIRIHQRRL